MIMDASMNISMEPFRALVADKLPAEQHTLGFSIQSLLIGIGAVVGSWLPYILSNWLGIPNEASGKGLVAPNVVFSFYIGATVLILSILWTVFTTNEYPPEFYEDTRDNIKKETKVQDSGYNVAIAGGSVFLHGLLCFRCGFTPRPL